jgi:hypothetical protein
MRLTAQAQDCQIELVMEMGQVHATHLTKFNLLVVYLYAADNWSEPVRSRPHRVTRRSRALTSGFQGLVQPSSPACGYT